VYFLPTSVNKICWLRLIRAV